MLHVRADSGSLVLYLTDTDVTDPVIRWAAAHYQVHSMETATP